MSISGMSREAFLDWAERQEERYEFDGVRPVGMTRGTFAEDVLCQNLWAALRSRLRGTGCTSGGPGAGIATVGNAVRYPDAYVTCSKVPGDDKLVPGVVVIFEVASPGSGRVDRIVKLREYAVVASILRYVPIESTIVGVTCFARSEAGAAWTASVAPGDETLELPEIGITIPVAELYEGLDLPA